MQPMMMWVVLALAGGDGCTGMLSGERRENGAAARDARAAEDEGGAPDPVASAPIILAPGVGQRGGGDCPTGEAWIDGVCRALFGSSAWSGICLERDAICRHGGCTPERAQGACPEGRCIGDAGVRCDRILWPDDACFACAWNALELERCDPGPDEGRACIDCPGEPVGEPGAWRYPTTCECQSRPSCVGCEGPATTFWECLLGECPVCGG